MANEQIWIPIIEALFILVVVFVLLYRYKDEKTPPYVLILTGVGWFFAFSVILFIPIDVFMTTTEGEASQGLTIWWYINYWSAFTLNWLINPFYIGYLDAGEFTRKGRSRRSIIYNAPYYLIYVVIFAGLVAFLYLSKKGQNALNNEGLVGIIIGLGLASGLLWLALLLGYGLVQIPVATFKYSLLEKRLHQYQYQAGYYEDKISEVLYEKAQNINQLFYIAQRVTVEPEHEAYKEKMLDNMEKSIEKARQNDLLIESRSFMDADMSLSVEYTNGILSYDKLCQLNKKLKNGMQEVLRIQMFKVQAIQEAIIAEDILVAIQRVETGGDKAIISPYFELRDRKRCCNRMLNWIVYTWYVHIQKWSLRVLGVFFGLCSIFILVAECSNFFDYDDYFFSDLIMSSYQKSGVSFAIANVVCLLPLSYIGGCAFFGMFNFKVDGVYALNRGQTDPVSLIYSAMLLMRLAVPVAYNFLDLVGLQDSAFYDVMGAVDTVNFLGEGFNRWVFPITLLIMVFMTVFNICGRFLSCIGMKQYSYDYDHTEEKILEGKHCIETYRKNKFAVFSSMTSDEYPSPKINTAQINEDYAEYHMYSPVDSSRDIQKLLSTPKLRQLRQQLAEQQTTNESDGAYEGERNADFGLN